MYINLVFLGCVFVQFDEFNKFEKILDKVAIMLYNV